MTTDPTDLDRTRLDAALRLAHDTLAAGNKPFGAVLVAADGRVLATGRNTVAQTGDPTSHAELEAVRAVTTADRPDVVGATMYASGEPCPMCAAALVWSGVARIVFGTAAADIRAVAPGPPGFTLRCADVAAAAAEATVDVVGPLLGDEGLEPFRRHRAEH
ncbi:nucleoside deaminase [Isoptericola jiangsuensis]|uniref:nucleoside deaminase n=1 Tax=Isoptericola jiangsuensis TaxID=548579 RepID=UPI001B807E44|nr:nucleoside deaminase [Isoptericola jiangsuensis]